jgi:hypothetical protein
MKNITVFGTNVLGNQASGTAAVYRRNLAESVPRIGTNVLIFPANGSVLDAALSTDIVWRVDGIMDDANDTNLMIAKISVLVRDDSSQVAVVALNFSNVLAQTPWLVPSDLIDGSTTYVVRFDVVDNTSLTGSMVFVDNPFTIVPEPVAGIVIAMLMVLRFIRRS